MPPGLEPFPLTAAILGIVAFIVWPVVKEYRSSMEKRLADKDAVIAQERQRCTDDIKRVEEDHKREMDRLLDDRGRILEERDRFIDLAMESAQATKESAQAAQRVVSVVENRAEGARRGTTR